MIAIRMYAQSLNIDFSVQGIHTFLVNGRTPILTIEFGATVVVCDRQKRELKLIVLDASAVPNQQYASNSSSASTRAKIQSMATNL